MPAKPEGETFRNQDYTKTRFPFEKCDSCTFSNCNFSEQSLTEVNFTECRFVSCDFSNARFGGTFFKDVQFTECKMTGADFSSCSTFLLKIELKTCKADYASFRTLPLANAHFNHCSFLGTDFTETDLKQAVFNDCDLQEAVFERTDLREANLVSAVNFTIDPEENRIKGARFSRWALGGLLRKYRIVAE